MRQISRLCSFHFNLLRSKISHKRFYSVEAKNSPEKPKFVEICGQKYATDEWTNVTPKIISFIGRKLYQTPPNPIYLIAESIKEHFVNYDVFDYPSPVVDLEANFDSLLIPRDHVSRARADTYYINRGLLLRAHTSAHQAHCLRRGSSQFVCLADVYRRDAIDATHFPVFHQCEALQLLSKSDVSLDF